MAHVGYILHVLPQFLKLPLEEQQQLLYGATKIGISGRVATVRPGVKRRGRTCCQKQAWVDLERIRCKWLNPKTSDLCGSSLNQS